MFSGFGPNVMVIWHWLRFPTEFTSFVGGNDVGFRKRHSRSRPNGSRGSCFDFFHFGTSHKLKVNVP